jgi:p-aminobenzoyl-glutamate transporter AbgT
MQKTGARIVKRSDLAGYRLTLLGAVVLTSALLFFAPGSVSAKWNCVKGISSMSDPYGTVLRTSKCTEKR